MLLTFGAVDSEARVWVNGQLVAEHVGGYTPFMADITDALIPDGAQEVVVRAYDDPHDLAKPRGKQDWRLNSHSIWYPRTTGIWQSVWSRSCRPRTSSICAGHRISSDGRWGSRRGSAGIASAMGCVCT